MHHMGPPLKFPDKDQKKPGRYTQESKMINSMEAIGGFFLNVGMFVLAVTWKVGVPLGAIFLVVCLAAKVAS